VHVKEVLEEALRHQDELVDALGSTFDRRTSNVLHRSDRATITHFLLPPTTFLANRRSPRRS
jgi:hypothetical protein